MFFFIIEETILEDFMRLFIKIAFTVVLLAAMPLFAQETVDQEDKSQKETVKDVTKFRLLYNDVSWIQFHYFLQTGYEGFYNEDLEEWNNDFVLKTSRFILNGQAADNVYFFMQTDDILIDDESKSEGTNNIFTKDAYLTFQPFNWFQIYSGMLAVPFTRQGIQTEATTLTVDRNSNFMAMSGYGSSGRDAGVMLRGFLAADYLEYRLGAFQGLRETEDNPNVVNDKEIPRFSGRIMVNLLDKEEGYYVSENYLGKREVASLGFGMDYQRKVYIDGDSKKHDYLAFTLDFTLDKKLNWGDNFSAQAALIKGYNNPVDGWVPDESNPGTGQLNYTDYLAYYLQMSYFSRSAHSQFYARYDYRKNYSYEKEKTLTGGYALHLNGHNANIKVEYTHPLFGTDSTQNTKKYSVIAQVYLF